MFQTILWDLDGTLTDPMVGITKSVQYALAAVGHPEPDHTKLTSFIGPPLRTQFALWCGFDPKADQAQIEFCVAKYRERFGVVGWKENKVLPGIHELLSQLKRAGRQMAIATSKPTEYTMKIVKEFGLESYFDCIVGASMDSSRDTKHKVIEEVLRQLQVKEKTQTVMIGDRYHDIDGGKGAGLATIGVMFGYGTREEFLEHGADYIVNTVEELGEMLFSQSGSLLQ